MKGYKKVILLLLLICLVIILYIFGIEEHLTFEQLKSHKAGLLHFVEHHYLFSVFGFIIIYILVAGMALPGGPVLTMTGGFIFGILEAAIYVNIGATTGATIAFLLSRYLVGDWVQARFKDKWAAFNRQFAQNGVYYILTLRFAPGVPFTWINLSCGLTNIRISPYIWTTSLGIFPGTLVFSYIGSQLGHIDSPEDLLSFGVWAAFLLLSVFAFLPVIYKRLRKGTVGS